MALPRSASLILVLFLLCVQVVDISSHGSGTHEDGTGSGAGAVHLHSGALVRVKICCILIFLLTTFAGGLSPFFLRWNESFLVFGTQFAGGVFLGTALMHFLSDSVSAFDKLTKRDYPLGFMLASVGYLLTMFGDCVINWVAINGTGGQKEFDVEDQEEARKVHLPAFTETSSVGDTVLLILALCFHSVFEGIAVGIAETEADAWRSLWTISLHKIFAAIAMGIALLRMAPERPLLTAVAYSFAFAVSSPVGVGIGIAIDATTEGVAADWIFAISMGLAAGVFVYVAINHLISKGYVPQRPSSFDNPFLKFFAVLLGVGVIAVVMIWD